MLVEQSSKPSIVSESDPSCSFSFRRREAVRVRLLPVRAALRKQQRPQEAHARAHVRQALRVQDVRQVLHAPQLPAQTHHEGKSGERLVTTGWVYFYAQQQARYARPVTSAQTIPCESKRVRCADTFSCGFNSKLRIIFLSISFHIG